MSIPAVHLNGVDYRLPDAPVVVICIDGGDPAYIAKGIEHGVIPTIKAFVENGFYADCEGTVPSFTCPNNMSLITGSPPAVHGISGNFYLDSETGEAVVMTGPELLRSETILKKLADAGAKVASVTAKDKLRKQLAKGLDLSKGHISISAEKASESTLADNGIDSVLDWLGLEQPDMYSMDLSLFVLKAGIKILKDHQPDVMFLSLTDYIQHKYAPGDAVANNFYSALDEEIRQLHETGAIVALTADHGMNDKSCEDNTPNIIFVQDLLDEQFGEGKTRVICPITDSFVKHHGALGGFVRVYIQDESLSVDTVLTYLNSVHGIDMALSKRDVCERFMLPPDREGDIAVMSQTNVALGAKREDHDLSSLGDFRLRTHGGLTEATVPMIINRPLKDDYVFRARENHVFSYEVFDFAINGVRTA